MQCLGFACHHTIVSETYPVLRGIYFAYNTAQIEIKDYNVVYFIRENA